MAHYGIHLREAFCRWVDEGMPANAEAAEGYVPVRWSAEKLLGRMTHCTDIMPRGVCEELELARGSTYSAAAQRLLAERRCAQPS
jgi:hypothetical protein